MEGWSKGSWYDDVTSEATAVVERLSLRYKYIDLGWK